MLKIKKFKLSKPVPFVKLLPNFLTLVGLTIGLSSIRFALDNRFEMAVYCVFIAAIIDGLDGRVARMLNATSAFGAELDSLCDFANFGIAPSMLIYLWSMQQYEYKLLSWVVMSLFMICMAIRLARFNISIQDPNQEKKAKYFAVGVPAPSGAMLALIPIILDFKEGAAFGFNVQPHTLLIDTYIAIIAFLLASRLPTLLLKNIHIKPEYLSFAMILSAIIILNLLIYPWYSLPVIAILYILSIPICMIIVKRKYE